MQKLDKRSGPARRYADRLREELLCIGVWAVGVLFAAVFVMAISKLPPNWGL